MRETFCSIHKELELFDKNIANFLVIQFEKNDILLKYSLKTHNYI